MSNNTGRENVIFLALSTINAPRNVVISLTRYYAKGIKDKKEPCIFNGYSQLEPGTKYLLNILAKDKKRADRIVIICSKEAAENEIIDPMNSGAMITALDLYRNRIRQYISGVQDDGLAMDKGVQNPEERYAKWKTEKGFRLPAEVQSVQQTKFIGAELYQGMKLEDDFFKVVDAGSVDAADYPNDYFWRAMTAVKGESGKAIDLYMDMQGGDRNALFEMNSVVEMLKDQNVTVKRRIACKYHRDNLFNEVTDVGRKYRQYDLLTAEQIFKRYGWGEELVNFFKDGRNEADKQMAEVIQKASDAIKMCDVDGFDSALIELGRMLRSRKKQGGRKTKLDLILEDIENDYTADLLDEDSAKPLRYVRQIRWCLKKNFIQQALTILESRMPTEYVRCGLRYYCDSQADVAKLRNTFEAMYGMLESPLRYHMININHYFINCYHKDKNKGVFSELTGRADICYPLLEKTALSSGEAAVEKNLKEYVRLKNIRNRINHASSTRTDYSQNSFYKYMRDKNNARRENEKDKNWMDEPVNEGELIRRIEKYLAEFERLYGQTDSAKVGKIIDMR